MPCAVGNANAGALPNNVTVAIIVANTRHAETGLFRIDNPLRTGHAPGYARILRRNLVVVTNFIVGYNMSFACPSESVMRTIEWCFLTCRVERSHS